MPVVDCPQCGEKLEVDAESAGQEVQCGACMRVFTATFNEPPARPSRRFSREDDDRRRHPDDEDYAYDRRPGRLPSKGGNGMGIASMVCGIVGLLGSCCCIFFVAAGIVGIVLGILSLKTPGRGMGIAGIVCGSLSIVMLVVSIILNVGMGMANIGAGGAGGGAPAFRGGR
jgi:hypothetical protein